MKAELTAIIEPAPEGGYWAICPEVPGANGQGETVEKTKRNLIEAIQLIFEDRRSDIMRGLPEDAIQKLCLSSSAKGRSGKSWKKGKAYSQTPEARLRQPEPHRGRAPALTPSQSNRFVNKPSHSL